MRATRLLSRVTNKGASWLGILDRLSVRPEAAFAQRKISSAINLALRVRRSSDSAELDIGFSSVLDASGNYQIDSAALLTFVGAGDGFMVTQYDQTGNGRHMTQALAANQPRIVTSGVLELASGKPAIYTTLLLSASVNPAAWLVTGNADRTLNCVMTRRAGTTMSTWSGQHAANSAWGIDLSVVSFTPYTYGAGDTTNAGTATDVTVIATALRLSGTSNGYKNGSLSGTNSNAISTTAANGLGIGLRPDAAQCTGHYTEIVYFSSGISTSDRQLLERNQGAYLGITVA